MNRRLESFNRKELAAGSSSSRHKRVEVWISPVDGSSVTSQLDEDGSEEEDPHKMACNEVRTDSPHITVSCAADSVL